MIKIKISPRGKMKGAIVVLIDSADRTLIMLRPKEARWAPYKWGFPGGKIETGENPEETAVREAKEETQLDVRNLKPLNLEVRMPVATYYTRDYSGTVEIDYEHDDWVWVARSEIEKYDLAPDVLEMFNWVLENE